MGWKPPGLQKSPSQNPGRIPKIDPSRGVPIKYPLVVVRVPNQGIYFLDPPGGSGFSYLVVGTGSDGKSKSARAWSGG